ncbi:hypothetical protein LINPERPRIM_LOCUS25630 [Linum perenne]
MLLSQKISKLDIFPMRTSYRHPLIMGRVMCGKIFKSRKLQFMAEHVEDLEMDLK